MVSEPVPHCEAEALVEEVRDRELVGVTVTERHSVGDTDAVCVLVRLRVGEKVREGVTEVLGQPLLEVVEV